MSFLKRIFGIQTKPSQPTPPVLSEIDEQCLSEFARSLRELIIKAQTGFEGFIGKQRYVGESGDTSHETTLRLVSSEKTMVWRRTNGDIDYNCSLKDAEFPNVSLDYYRPVDAATIFRRRIQEIEDLLAPSWIVWERDLNLHKDSPIKGTFSATNQSNRLELAVWLSVYESDGQLTLSLTKTTKIPPARVQAAPLSADDSTVGKEVTSQPPSTTEGPEDLKSNFNRTYTDGKRFAESVKDAGGRVDEVVCEIVSGICDEGEPTVTPPSTDGPRDLNELIEILAGLRKKIENSNSEAFQLAKRVVPEQGRVLFNRLGITDTLLIVGFGEGLKSAAYSIKDGNQASALRLVDQVINVLTLYRFKTKS